MTKKRHTLPPRGGLVEQPQAQCPKCGAFSGGDWSQCKGFCPVPVSPHYHLSTEIEFGNRIYEGNPR